MRESHVSLIVAALTLIILPFALDFAGLPLRSSIDVVVFAIACMGLNILVGHTGLVSFGHGAWFGLAAYAAALSQRYWFPGTIAMPALFAIAFVAVSAALSGALILRRRGVYFSLLTLALTALLFAIAYRWTEFTGGDIFLMNKRYQIERGIIEFSNPNRTEPVLNVLLTTTISQYNLSLTFLGPLDKMQTNYVSDPPLPTADIINLIARGQTAQQAAHGATAHEGIFCRLEHKPSRGHHLR
jgi:ABC-type branched-subunit amino acid transport system permease subunit